MAEPFENLENILHDRVRDKVQKSLVALNKYEKQEEERKSGFFFRKWKEKIYSSSRASLSQTQKLMLSLEFNKPNKKTILRLI